MVHVNIYKSVQNKKSGQFPYIFLKKKALKASSFRFDSKTWQIVLKDYGINKDMSLKVG